MGQCVRQVFEISSHSSNYVLRNEGCIDRGLEMGVAMWSDGKMDLGVSFLLFIYFYFLSDSLKNGLAMKIKHIGPDKNRMLSESYSPEAL